MSWEFQSDRPIYAQLMEQIKRIIITGIYPPGEKMPSVRELAAEASVNPNTMQRAFAQLEQEGLLYTQRTSGRFVTEDQQRILEMKTEMADELAKRFLEDMEQLGYNCRQAIEVLERFEKESEKL